jgi:hypothetical protein
VTTFTFKKDNFPQSGGGGGWSGGGRGYTPRNSVAEESAKYPAFALAYANQYRIARESFEGREMTTEQTFVVANAYLTWLQSSTPKQAEAPAPAQSAPQSQPAQQSQPQAPDLNSLLWTKLAKLQLADRCRAAGVDFTMLQIWWSESNESDLAFASRIKAELQKAGV